jgi:hypothetical protein
MAESVLTYLDSYCERAGHIGGFAEPLNLITNGFFIIAAVMAAYALKHHSMHGKRIDLWLLTLFMFAIGIGSGLWHWQPNGVTVLMDVIPITLFMNLYLISALRRLFELSWRRVMCWWGLYVVLTFAGQAYLPPDMLHGTVMYLPTYAAMVALTYGVSRRNRQLGKVFGVVTTVWSVSLIARTIDLEICPSLSIGTHFLWHTLNAWVLWRLLMVLVRGR